MHENKLPDSDWIETKGLEALSCKRLPLAEHDIFFEDFYVDSDRAVLKARSRNGEMHFYSINPAREFGKDDLKDLSPDKRLIFLQSFLHEPTHNTYLVGLTRNFELILYEEKTGKKINQFTDANTQFLHFTIINNHNILGFYSETEASLLAISNELKISFVKKIDFEPNFHLLSLAHQSVIIQEKNKNITLRSLDNKLTSATSKRSLPVESFHAFSKNKSVFLGLVEGESMAHGSSLVVLKKDRKLTEKYLLKNDPSHLSTPYLFSTGASVYVSVIKWLDKDALFSVYELNENLEIRSNKSFKISPSQNYIVTGNLTGTKFTVVLRSKSETGWNYDFCTANFF